MGPRCQLDKLRLISVDGPQTKSEKATADMLAVMEAIVTEANHDPVLAERAAREDARYVRAAPPLRCGPSAPRLPPRAP